MFSENTSLWLIAVTPVARRYRRPIARSAKKLSREVCAISIHNNDTFNAGEKIRLHVTALHDIFVSKKLFTLHYGRV